MIEPSAHQKQIWQVEQIIRGRPYLHTGPILRIDGDLDTSALACAIQAAASGHALLRTGFTADGDTLRARPDAPEVAFDLVTMTPEVFANLDRLRQVITDLYHEPFAFDGRPLFRVHLITNGRGRHVLVLPMHRLICDASSIRVFVADIATAARGGSIAPGPSYYDAVAGDETRLTLDRTYWTDILADYPTITVGDISPQGEWSPDAQSFDLVIPGLVEALATQQAQRRATPFVLLASAVFTVLGETLGADDICIGTSFENRWSSDLQRLVGPISQAMLLRLRNAGREFTDVLDQVKAAFRGAVTHQHLPFDDVMAIVMAGGVAQEAMLPVILSVKPQKEAWPTIAGAAVASFELEMTGPVMVRPGQLDLEFRLDPDAPRVHALYDGSYMTSSYVREFVHCVVAHASGDGIGSRSAVAHLSSTSTVDKSTEDTLRS